VLDPPALGNLGNADAALKAAALRRAGGGSAFVSGDLYNGTPQEIKATFEGAIGYFGHMYA